MSKDWKDCLKTMGVVGAITAVCAIIAIYCSGCVYKGAKVTEGTDLCVGISIPASEGVAELNVLNYLSGFRLGVDRNAILNCKYTVAESNSYLGCINTYVVKTVDASVEPCETFSTNMTNQAVE